MYRDLVSHFIAEEMKHWEGLSRHDDVAEVDRIVFGLPFRQASGFRLSSFDHALRGSI
jgi:hypothetical protein